MLTLASSVRGLAPAIAPTPHADTFFGSASTATAGHWSGVAREAVLSGDRRVIRLDGLLSPSEAAALLAAARDTTFDEENDTVDDAATFLAPIIESGAVAPRNAALAALLAPLVDERLLPFVRERYGSPGACVADALIRRYSPDERSGLRAHFDVTALCTCIVPLSAPDEYEGGLYVQPGAGAASREYVPFGAAGDAVFHEWDVMHGVRVEAGRRHSLVLWFAEDAACVADGTAPWIRRAAEAGRADAQFIYADFCRAGLFGAPRDAAAAAEWYGRAAAQGSAHAQYWLGSLLVNGEGVDRDLGRAEALWREAAAQELEAAQFALGCALRDGGLFGGGEAEGERWLRRAAEQGHEGAVEVLASGD